MAGKTSGSPVFGNKPRNQEDGYIKFLSDLTHDDVNRVGGKAAKLGELVRAGFRVPDGFVVTTAAFDCFLSANNLCLDNKLLDNALRIPDDVAKALRSALRRFARTSLAVRSSAVAEDLDEASFAGQYETVLDVRGNSAVMAAILHCWASAFNQRVATYRGAQNAAMGSMAILVQRLVPAEAAGVAFTANPITGDRTETVISAVRGLGEKLVSGRISPDEWIVRGKKAECRRATEKAIDTAQALAISQLARQVGRHFGCPQDIEWALAGGELFILQSRPITALPQPDISAIPVAIEIPTGFWQRDASHYPRPLSPAARSILVPVTNTTFKKVGEEFGSMASAQSFREIGGWAYRGMVPIILEGESITISQKMKERIDLCVAAVQEDKAGWFMDLWYKKWQPELAKRIGELKDIPLDQLTDAGLDTHLEKVIDLFDEGSRVHYLLTAAYAFILYELMIMCREFLGWDEGQMFQLVNGVSAKSTEPARRLAELAQMAKNRPPVLHFVDCLDNRDTAENTVGALKEVDAEFAAAFADYQKEYGICALSLDVADTTLVEQPRVILALIRDQIRQSYDPEADRLSLEERRETTRAGALKILERRPPADLKRFQRALGRAELAYAVREDRELFTFSVPLALIRFAIVEVGWRLAKRGAIDGQEDVFSLETEEMQEALRSNHDQRDLIMRRRGERAWVEAHPGPVTYGTNQEPKLPFGALPPEAQFASSAVSWLIQNIRPTSMTGQGQNHGMRICGIPASPGHYTGPVRIIMDESEFGKINAGDVLVCTSTSPVWSVVFPSIGALVTNVGGILSHPAIIAREYGLPAVVATVNATEVLRDGQIVTVDGTAGVVKIACDLSDAN